MADVTISSLTRGIPSGSNILPYSTGSNTLGVPVSALFQGGSVVGIGTTTPIMPNEGYAVRSGLEIYNFVTAGIKLTTQNGYSFIRHADNNVTSNLIIDADHGSTSSGNTELRLNVRQVNIVNIQSNKVTITQPVEVLGSVKATNIPKFAWARFNGSGVIQDSYGVTSITPSAVPGYGNNIYKINVAAAGFSNANYSVTGMTRYSNSSNFMQLFTGAGEATTYNPTTTEFYVNTNSDQGVGINTHTNYIQVMGN